MLFLREEPASGQEVNRRSRRLYLRRVHRALQRDHRRRVLGTGDPQGRRPPEAARDQPHPQRVRDRPGGREEGPRRGRLQPLQAHPDDARRRRRHRASEVKHPARRADRLRQDAPSPRRSPRSSTSPSPSPTPRRSPRPVTWARMSRTSCSSSSRPPTST